MNKQRIIVSISKKDGEIKLETHGVKGKACLDMLEELLGEIVEITETTLTDEYDQGDEVEVDLYSSTDEQIQVEEERER